MYKISRGSNYFFPNEGENILPKMLFETEKGLEITERRGGKVNAPSIFIILSFMLE